MWFDVLEQRMGDRFAARTGGRAGFDPTIVIGLITVLLPMIQNCFKARPAQLRRRLGNRARLVTGLRRERPDLGWREAAEAVDDLFDVADKAKDEELVEFAAYCCN